MDPLHGALAFLALLLAAALVLGLVAERIRVPYTVVLVVAALPFSDARLPVHFEPNLLAVFLPALIFEAAWNLDLAGVRRYWRPIAFLSVPGVLVSAAAVGFGLAALGLLPLGPALIAGVILGATDPVAVVAVLRRLAIPADLATVVEAESLFNDGTAVVLYVVAVAVVGANASTSESFVRAGLSAVPAAGGVLLGLAVAALVAIPMRFVRERMLEIVGTVVAAYGSYLAADALGFSGIFATIAAGLGLRASRGNARDAHAGDANGEIDQFWAAIAFFANTLLFLLVGLRIEIGRMIAHPSLVAATLVLLVLARVALAYGALPWLAIGHAKPGWQTVVVLAGMRGALSLALALALPDTFPMRAQIIDAVYGAVFITLVGQGLTLAAVLKRIDFGTDADASHSPS